MQVQFLGLVDSGLSPSTLCVCVCVCVCVRACMRAYVCACVRAYMCVCGGKVRKVVALFLGLVVYECSMWGMLPYSGKIW